LDDARTVGVKLPRELFARVERNVEALREKGMAYTVSQFIREAILEKLEDR
jgi:hypothetical protein